MRIFIAGGRGHVGGRLAERLRRDGHEVVAGSRSNGIDVVTGEGLGAALVGVDAVVDVLNAQVMEAEASIEFFRGTTLRLLAAELTTGVRHHVLLSVVGADRATGNGYYAGKVAQEDAVRDEEVPFTVVRATQFHDFVPTIADWLTVDGVVQAPPTLLQPVDVDDVVDLLAEIATGGPLGEVVDIAGPDRFHLDDLIRSALAKEGDARTVRTVDGDALGATDAHSLVPLGAHRTGARRFPGANGVPPVRA
ncbi:SDR family oxidoreductase [Amnibacterium setariae]|uniref:NmrA family protein n=1 Tax=Amnibacterium setariae TaxID=2306585 RepID=A0A3A1TVY0_9MICO|nr:NmrA family NAD(P)-binding protein [Amnibacterium setariae]RIX28413.1 NmrA family protein [Amnibacterium setariae]